MTILSFGTDRTTLFFTCTDLSEQGLCIDNLTEENTVSLTRNALLQTDLSFSGELELDVYANPGGLLVFAHLAQQQQFVWYFPDFETVLCAAQAIPTDHANSCLYRWGQTLWLTVNQSFPQLSEFGTEATDELYILPQLQEHGTLLLPEQAISLLCRHFL